MVIGDYGLSDSNISQVINILISGNKCLYGTRFSSNFIDSTKWCESDRIFTLKINCNHSDNFHVYCNKGDTCNIDCLTNRACNGMNLHCNKNCHVSKGM